MISGTLRMRMGSSWSDGDLVKRGYVRAMYRYLLDTWFDDDMEGLLHSHDRHAMRPQVWPSASA